QMRRRAGRRATSRRGRCCGWWSGTLGRSRGFRGSSDRRVPCRSAQDTCGSPPRWKLLFQRSGLQTCECPTRTAYSRTLASHNCCYMWNGKRSCMQHHAWSLFQLHPCY
ncbi:unnamed protein product, partial [Closterium sp. NIES-54]